MARLFTIFMCCLFSTMANCQMADRDSLLHVLKQGREDTSAVFLYYGVGATYEDALPDSAIYYFTKAKELAKKLQFKKGEAAFSSYYIPILNNQGRFKEALEISTEALDIYKQLGNNKELAIAYLNVGNEWHYLSDFELAATHYLMAKKFADEGRDTNLQRKVTNNLASVFIELGEYGKGRQYAEAALGIARQMKNDYAIASSMYNVATAYIHLQQPGKALELYTQIREIGKRTSDDILVLDGWLGMADAHGALMNLPIAKAYFNETIKIAQQKNAPEYEMYANMGMADLLIKQGKNAAAAPYISNGIQLARQMGTRLELKDLYLKASQVEEAKGSLASALDFRKKFELLNDSIVGDKSKALVSNLEARYEFEKKENTIKALTNEKMLRDIKIRQKNTLNYVLICSALVLLLFIFLLYRNYGQRQKLQLQRIAELETEKKLTATEAVLKGEEQERSRLAKDLHDGLGGMLSGIKYSFNTIRGNLVMTAENAIAFERCIDMLDSSIKEMRRVAHNMMPEALAKFGLDAALADFCNEVNQTGALEVSYQSLGKSDIAIDQTVAIAAFRVVQELTNNILKHAGATHAIVQLTYGPNQIALTVEDDGKGFDKGALENAKGVGWSSITNRVNFLKGSIDIQTDIGKGTSVQIEIPLA